MILVNRVNLEPLTLHLSITMFHRQFLSSQALFDALYMSKINCHGSVCHNGKNMPSSFGKKDLQMKKHDRVSQVWENLRATYWRDKHEVYVIIFHILPAEGNFKDTWEYCETSAY
jgi:hypothetical protein